jgi:transposase-like protein
MSQESKRFRRQFNTEQKVAILRRHLVDKVLVSDLWDQYKMQPSAFFQWQRLVFENLAGALDVAGQEPRSARSN